MSAKVLIVEDDPALAEMLRYNFEAEGFRTRLAASGEEAELQIAEDRPDLVVLDWMLPSVSGIELCRRLRAKPQTHDLAVLMLTARGEEADRVRGLTVGADDYVVKPFSLPELMARARSLLRRAAPQRLADTLSVAGVELDRVTHRAAHNGRALHLGPTEWRLLEHFMEHRGRVLSRAQLLDGVWGSDAAIDERTVDVHVGRLRKALTAEGEADPIRTLRGAGYAFGER